MRRLTSTLQERIQALSDNRYLRGLQDRDLDYLAGHTHLQSYQADESIIHEGQSAEGLFIVREGRVKIFKGSPTGREMIITVLDSGDTFNEVPVFDKKENPANVAAVMETHLWLIDAEALRNLINDHPRAAQQIIINLSQNLRMLVDKVAELSFYTVTARLARLLRELPDAQLGSRGPGRLTQDELASMVGSVREVVARSLKELEKCGAIEVQRGRIKILNKEKLIDWDCP